MDLRTAFPCWEHEPWGGFCCDTENSSALPSRKSFWDTEGDSKGTQSSVVCSIYLEQIWKKVNQLLPEAQGVLGKPQEPVNCPPSSVSKKQLLTDLLWVHRPVNYEYSEMPTLKTTFNKYLLLVRCLNLVFSLRPHIPVGKTAKSFWIGHGFSFLPQDTRDVSL